MLRSTVSMIITIIIMIIIIITIIITTHWRAHPMSGEGTKQPQAHLLVPFAHVAACLRAVCNGVPVP